MSVIALKRWADRPRCGFCRGVRQALVRPMLSIANGARGQSAQGAFIASASETAFSFAAPEPPPGVYRMSRSVTSAPPLGTDPCSGAPAFVTGDSTSVVGRGRISTSDASTFTLKHLLTSGVVLRHSLGLAEVEFTDDLVCGPTDIGGGRELWHYRLIYRLCDLHGTSGGAAIGPADGLYSFNRPTGSPSVAPHEDETELGSVNGGLTYPDQFVYNSAGSPGGSGFQLPHSTGTHNIGSTHPATDQFLSQVSSSSALDCSDGLPTLISQGLNPTTPSNGQTLTLGLASGSDIHLLFHSGGIAGRLLTGLSSSVQYTVPAIISGSLPACAGADDHSIYVVFVSASQLNVVFCGNRFTNPNPAIPAWVAENVRVDS